MMLRAVLVALALAAAAAGGALRAETAAVSVAETYEVMRIPELLQVMQEEGRGYGETLAGQLFEGAGDPGWAETVAGIYDLDRMDRVFRAEFDRRLEGDEAARAAAAAYFGQEPGRKILGLEIEARRALLDDGVEEAATLAFQDMEDRKDPRVALLRRFAEENDLVEANVTGALNANLAFLRAMAAAGGAGAGNEGDLLAEVWGEEPQVRAETEAWLFPFLALAYQPLSDQELEGYIAFSATPEGQRLNRALVGAFDALFVTLSAELGRAAGLEVKGQDI